MSQGFYYSSHYAQAYAQALHPQYGLSQPSSSSTINGSAALNPAWPQRTHLLSQAPQIHRPIHHGPWYQPGDVRCGHESCSFVGSKKAVEIHKMDRHLIYPPWWDSRKKATDWDADPSLKGKKLPIQGTNLILDTPEDIDSWIAERRKRWPSTARVAEKEQKHAEAVARGQIQDPLTRPAKKRRFNDEGSSDRGRGRGGYRGRGRGQDNVPRVPIPLPPKPQTTIVPPPVVDANLDSDTSSESDSDMDPEKDAVSSKGPNKDLDTPQPELSVEHNTLPELTSQPVANESETADKRQSHREARRQIRQPRPPPHNPFDRTRDSSLLQKMLLPEIRVAVSNFSQALRFLVDNDFLDGVELKPGEAEEQQRKLIQEVSSASNA